MPRKPNLLKELSQQGYVYLNLHDKSTRIHKALRVAKGFMEYENFVPGFDDILFISSKKMLPVARKYAKDLDITCLYASEVKESKSMIPDVVIIDTPGMLHGDIEESRRRFSHLPIIFVGSEDVPDTLKMIVDTREQLPLWKGNKCKKRTLNVGDYTTEALLNKFHIERKSPQDLYGTLTRGHVRFRNELIRAEHVSGVKLVMFVECSRETFVNLQFKGAHRYALTGAHVGKIVATIENKYGLEVVWCKTRAACKKAIEARLKEEQKTLAASTSRKVGAR
jgi:hypothetical protein